MVKVGVLAVQGDFLEHAEIVRDLGVEVVYVRKPNDLAIADALIIPGGESTTIGSLIEYRGLRSPIVDFATSGRPILGTCAGTVLLAKRVVDRIVGETGQSVLGVMNINVTRNAFGRQRESFEATVWVEDIGEVRAAFIRAPAIDSAWQPARIAGYVEHPALGKVGAVAIQGNLLAVTFHPEITGDRKIHEYFINLVKR